MAGDFNLNLLKHSSHPPTDEFLNLLMSFNFLPTICHPTRITDFSETLIDNIFVNCLKFNFHSAIVYTDISDRLSVALHLASIARVKPANNLTRRSFDSKSIKKFNYFLAMTDWSCVHNGMLNIPDVFIAYDCFFNKFKTTDTAS